MFLVSLSQGKHEAHYEFMDLNNFYTSLRAHQYYERKCTCFFITAANWSKNVQEIPFFYFQTLTSPFLKQG